MGDMLYPFDFVSAEDVSYLGSFYYMAGIIGGSLASYFLFKLVPKKGKKLYLYVSHSINFGSLLTFGLIMLSIHLRSLGFCTFLC